MPTAPLRTTGARIHHEVRGEGPLIVLGIGDASAGQLCDRTSRALAGALGLAPTLFPGGHVGFVEDPPAFVARLREVLADLPAQAHQ